MVQISVLMPVYNAEKYVALAVESILGQTFSDFELIIIDDGSTDGSLAILRRYQKQDSRIRLTSRPNTGLVTALNEMLRTAKGEFIARMDADDVSLPSRFERQIRHLTDHPECVVVGSRVMLTDPEGRDIMPFREQTTHDQIDSMHLSDCGGAVICHPTAMMRRIALERVGGYDATKWPAEDLHLFLRLAEIGRVANLPSIELRYRLHSASTSIQHRARQVEMMRHIVAEARKRRGLPALRGKPMDRGEQSTLERFRMWAWWALRAGNRSTAWKYAARALCRAPVELESWKLLACVARGY